MKEITYSAFAYKFQMVKDRELSFQAEDVSNVKSAADIIRDIIRQLGQTDRENVVVAMLNAKNIVVGVNLVSIGSLSTAAMEPREILKMAMFTPGCSAIIVGHNHPSGECTPSYEDLVVTRRLVPAAKLLGVYLHDHIIVSTHSDAYYSFLKEGQLDLIISSARPLLSAIGIIK